MNENIKAQWIAALRSGEYTQCPGALRKVSKDTKGKRYCCLGVLTDLAVADGVGTWDDSCGCAVCEDGEVQTECELVMGDGDRVSSFADSIGDVWNSYLPFEVKEWADMSSDATNDILMTLMDMNDSGNSTFEQIANYIESSDIL